MVGLGAKRVRSQSSSSIPSEEFTSSSILVDHGGVILDGVDGTWTMTDGFIGKRQPFRRTKNPRLMMVSEGERGGRSLAVLACHHQPKGFWSV